VYVLIAIREYMTKYGNRRTYSTLCGRTFASKLECKRADQLKLQEMAGEIHGLIFQKRFELSKDLGYGKVSIVVDFRYERDGKIVYEDTKGKLLETFRVKLAWLKKEQGIDVWIIRKDDI